MTKKQKYHQKYHKEWYIKNKKKRKIQIFKRRDDISNWMAELKASLKCGLCPESHPATLDFHHLDPTKKEIQLAYVANSGWSKKRILKEIDKCKVLCSNCHRKLHHKS